MPIPPRPSLPARSSSLPPMYFGLSSGHSAKALAIESVDEAKSYFPWHRLPPYLQRHILKDVLLPGSREPLILGHPGHRTHLDRVAIPIFLALGRWDDYLEAASVLYAEMHFLLPLYPTAIVAFLTCPDTLRTRSLVRKLHIHMNITHGLPLFDPGQSSLASTGIGIPVALSTMRVHGRLRDITFLVCLPEIVDDDQVSSYYGYQPIPSYYLPLATVQIASWAPTHTSGGNVRLSGGVHSQCAQPGASFIAPAFLASRAFQCGFLPLLEDGVFDRVELKLEVIRKSGATRVARADAASMFNYWFGTTLIKTLDIEDLGDLQKQEWVDPFSSGACEGELEDDRPIAQVKDNSLSTNAVKGEFRYRARGDDLLSSPTVYPALLFDREVDSPLGQDRINSRHNNAASSSRAVSEKHDQQDIVIKPSVSVKNEDSSEFFSSSIESSTLWRSSTAETAIRMIPEVLVAASSHPTVITETAVTPGTNQATEAAEPEIVTPERQGNEREVHRIGTSTPSDDISSDEGSSESSSAALSIDGATVKPELNACGTNSSMHTTPEAGDTTDASDTTDSSDIISQISPCVVAKSKALLPDSCTTSESSLESSELDSSSDEEGSSPGKRTSRPKATLTRDSSSSSSSDISDSDSSDSEVTASRSIALPSKNSLRRKTETASLNDNYKDTCQYSDVTTSPDDSLDSSSSEDEAPETPTKDVSPHLTRPEISSTKANMAGALSGLDETSSSESESESEDQMSPMIYSSIENVPEAEAENVGHAQTTIPTTTDAPRWKWRRAGRPLHMCIKKDAVAEKTNLGIAEGSKIATDTSSCTSSSTTSREASSTAIRSQQTSPKATTTPAIERTASIVSTSPRKEGHETAHKTNSQKCQNHRDDTREPKSISASRKVTQNSKKHPGKTINFTTRAKRRRRHGRNKQHNLPPKNA